MEIYICSVWMDDEMDDWTNSGEASFLIPMSFTIYVPSNTHTPVQNKYIFPSIRSSSILSSIYPSIRSTPRKLRGCRLHTIPLLSLTLPLSAHQEWEGNKLGMAFHPCPYLDTSSSSMCCLLAGRCINNHHV